MTSTEQTHNDTDPGLSDLDVNIDDSNFHERNAKHSARSSTHSKSRHKREGHKRHQRASLPITNDDDTDSGVSQVTARDLEAMPDSASAELAESRLPLRDRSHGSQAGPTGAPPRRAPSSYQAPGPALRAPLIGHAETLQRLKHIFLESWDQRQLSAVVLSGAAGSGKTRVAQEFARSVSAAIPQARVLRGAVSRTDAGPYAAISAALAQRFGVGRAEAAEDIREKISRAVDELLPGEIQEEVTQLIAHIMGLPFPKSSVVADSRGSSGSRDLRMRAHIAVRRFLEEESEGTPLLLCLDGIELARQETIDLVSYLVQTMRSRPVMILLGAHPSFFDAYPAWQRDVNGNHHVSLEAMTPSMSAELLQTLLGLSNVPDALRKTLNEHLAGNPRAIYDLARLFQETGIIEESADGKKKLSLARATALPLPHSHRDLIRTRLSLLRGAERRIIRQASLIGESFWLSPLLALARRTAEAIPFGPLHKNRAVAHTEILYSSPDPRADEIDTSLRALVERGVIIEVVGRTIPGEREYRFTYDTIYQLASSLEPSARDQLGHSTNSAKNVSAAEHLTIAQWLYEQAPAKNAALQENAGHHFEAGGDFPGAAKSYLLAAMNARNAFHIDDALRLLDTVVAFEDRLPLTPRLRAWQVVGEIHRHCGRLKAAHKAFEAMLQAAWRMASKPRIAEALLEIGVTWRARGRIGLALSEIKSALALARETENETLIAKGLNEIGQIYRLMGRNDASLDFCGQSLEIRRRSIDKHGMMTSLLAIGAIEADLGLFDAAESCFRESYDIGRELAADFDSLITMTEARVQIGDVEYQRGHRDEAKTTWEKALRESERIGAHCAQQRIHRSLSALALKEEKIDLARKHIDQAQKLAASSDDIKGQAQALRISGLIAHASGDDSSALDQLNQALISVTAEKMLPLRGALEMAFAEVQAATIFDASAGKRRDKKRSHAHHEAVEHFQRAIECFDLSGNTAKLARALRRFAQYQLERSETKLGKKTLKRAASLFKSLNLDVEREDVEQISRDLGL